MIRAMLDLLQCMLAVRKGLLMNKLFIESPANNKPKTQALKDEASAAFENPCGDRDLQVHRFHAQMSFLSSRSITAALPSSLASSPKPSRRRNPPLLPSITPLVRSHLIHFSARFMPLSPSKSISLETSINPPRAAWQQPKYVYPDPIPEFAVAVSSSTFWFLPI